MQPARSLGRHTLQRRVATIVAAGLVVSFVLFGVLALEAVKQSTQAVFQERLMMARITAGLLDHQIKEALDYLQAEPEARNFDPSRGSPEAKRAALAEIRARLPIFAQQVYLVDRNGTVTMAEPSPSALEGASLFDYVHVRRILEGSTREVSGVVLDPITRNPTVALAVPVTDATGRTVGVLGASVDVATASLGSLILDLKPGQTGHTQILDGNGTVMASTRPDLVMRRSNHYELLFSLIRQKVATVVSHATENDAESFREIVAFAPLTNASWGVSVEQSESEALSVGQELETRLIVLGLLSLLGALATCVVVLRRVLIPIESLTFASERIAAGVLSGPLGGARAAAVGRLASAFETMRERLSQSRDELDRWHRELEMRVRRRTAELSCLFELSKTIASSVELDEMLRAAVHRVVQVLEGADAAYIYLLDPAPDRLVLKAWQGELPEGLGSTFTMLASQATSSRRATWRDGLGLPEYKNGVEVGVLTCAPLLTQEHAFGALLLVTLASPARTAAADLPLVQALADQIAVGIERAQLAREAEQAEALREADRLKSQFISAITHELQTPLGFIKGYATTLLRSDAEFDQETRFEFLQIIDEESDSLSALIDDLLDVSRIESGALSIEKQPVRLPSLVRHAVARVKSRSSLHQIETTLSPRLPAVDADPRRLEQVLLNLLDNAMKYSPQGGIVRVSAVIQGATVIISVADHGIGISSDEQGRVFDRFYRTAGAMAVSRRGVGLGLPICRGIVEAHGGRIWIDSRSGIGTTVSFSLGLALGVEGEEPLPEPASLA